MTTVKKDTKEKEEKEKDAARSFGEVMRNGKVEKKDEEEAKQCERLMSGICFIIIVLYKKYVARVFFDVI